MQRALFYVLLSVASVAGAEPLKLYLDPGHTPKQPGAIGAEGRAEVGYNDAFTAALAAKLDGDAAFHVELTRGPQEELSLLGRDVRANAGHGQLFLAIHHDSAHPKYLEQVGTPEAPAFRAVPALRERFTLGFSLFVSRKNPRFAESLALARSIGRELVAAGRAPSTHHTEPISNEGRTFLDAALGVYAYDDLLVLKHAQMPAVLLEVGVIVDAADLSAVRTPESRRKLAEAVQRGLDAYARGLAPKAPVP